MIFFALLSCVLMAGGVIGQCTEGEVCCEGCRSYQVCQSNAWVQIDCDYPTEVYNYAEQQCTDPKTAPPPCGEFVDCSELPDASYPDLNTSCEFYFTCIGGINYGHQTCNPGLVFDYEEQICNWPENVDPPCGTEGTTPLPILDQKVIKQQTNREEAGQDNDKKAEPDIS